MTARLCCTGRTIWRCWICTRGKRLRPLREKMAEACEEYRDICRQDEEVSLDEESKKKGAVSGRI